MPVPEKQRTLSEAASKIVKDTTEELLPNLLRDELPAVEERIYGELLKRISTEELLDALRHSYGPRANYFGGLSRQGRVNADTVDFVQSGISASAGNVQTELRRLVYPEQYGALRDGTTDDLAAFQAADTYLVSLGGGVLRLLPGTYALSARYQPSNGISVEGAGMGVTNIKNTASSSPSNIAIDIRGTLSGTTYAINAPTEGGLTVTTTTAGNAGNFTAGDSIAIHGALSGNDYIPLWIATVSTAVAATGVITLTERLLRGGATITSVQKVTSLKQNIAIRRLSITQSADVGLIVKYAKGVTLEEVDATTGITSSGISLIGCRDITVQRCKSFVAISAHSCTNPKLIDNRLAKSRISLEGGCEGGLVCLNEIADPSDANNGINITTGSQRVQVINNTIEVMGGSAACVSINGNGANEGENVIAFNKMSGGGSSGNAVIIGGTRSDNNTVAFNSIRDISTGIRADTSSANQRILGNYFASTVPTSMTITGSATVATLIDSPPNVLGDWFTVTGQNSVTAKYGIHASRNGGTYHDVPTNKDHSWRVNGSDVMYLDASGIHSSVRIQAAQGTQVGSAGSITLGNNGNRFQVSGTTTINLIDNTNWQGGAIVTLHFQGSLTVKHNQASSTTFMPIMLSGAADFSATASDQLTLQYDSADTKWYEIARTVI